jgi:serine/threonine protein kinase
MSFGAGERLGPYEILAFVGAGGMGEVWKARDTRLDRVVAVKRLKGEYSARFEHEARAIAALNHPHICQIHDVGPDYLVLEYVEGEPLCGPLSPQETVRLAIQIASALEEAHARGILHRDLKPGNILVTAKGTAKLLDFGLAKLMTHSEAEVTKTLEGTVMGTAAYLAPEQAEAKPVDARSDIFSFGAVLYELLSGRRAFHGANTIATIAAILHKEPAPLEAPATLQQIVIRCLAKSPGQRYQTMAELRETLERAAHTAGKPAFEETELARLESRLAGSVGPIAKTLVAKAAIRHATLPALCRDLAEQIPGEADRQEFLRSFGLPSGSHKTHPSAGETPARRAEFLSDGSPVPGTQSAPLDERTIDAARRALAVYLGPMASMVVKKTARSVDTKEELKRALAAEIPDEQARRAFLESF